ncbi:MAG: hypothetical protein ACR2KB_17550 [Chitinophagaceae bacterium]
MRKESPIIFSTPMVQAILDGRKTQTRRIIKISPRISSDPNIDLKKYYDEMREYILSFCPFGTAGDLLWVREKWKENETPTGYPYHHYADDDVYTNKDNEKWKPSIHMPKEACRLRLEVESVRVERLQDISEEDAELEGAQPVLYHSLSQRMEVIEPSHIFYEQAYAKFQTGFKMLWQKINGQKSWDENPWVWVILFKVL